MVKKLAIFLLFSVFSYAFDLNSSANALSSGKDLQISLENLDTNGSLNVGELVSRLKQSSNYDALSFSSNSLNLKFISTQKVPSALFVKSINLALEDANISVARVNSLKNSNEISYGILALKSGGIDPNLLNFTLSKSGFKIMGFDRLDGNLALYPTCQKWRRLYRRRGRCK